jgi:hypothetical protein
VHVLWFVDGETIHMSAGAPDFQPRNPKTTSSTASSTCAIASKPSESAAGGCRERAKATTRRPAAPRAKVRQGFSRAQHQRFSRAPDRAYVGYIDGGAMILDISTSRGRSSFPTGAIPAVQRLHAHRAAAARAQPADRRRRSVMDAGADWPKLVWVVDARVETNLVPIATLPAPPYQEFVRAAGGSARTTCTRTCRAGLWRSEQIVIGTFFNAACARTTC